MKKIMRAAVALLLVICLCFGMTGCAGVDFVGYFEQLILMMLGGMPSSFSQMEYVRPDLDALQTVVEDCVGKIPDAKNLDAVISLIWEAYEPLDQFSTAYALANIHYSMDLTDPYWEEEYLFCSEGAVVAQAALDQIYRALAQSQFREELEGDDYFGTGFFDDYEGDSFYDEVFSAMLTREAELENQYYTLCGQAADAGYHTEAFYADVMPQMAQLFVDLVAVRQEMAAYLGYESYPEFAYDYYYDRDYTCQQTTAYLADIRAELVPMYQQVASGGLDVEVGYCSEAAALGYLRQMAKAMGGTIQEAFDVMENYGLYDISYSENKYDASFEIYISNYYSPFIFINPTMSEYDKLTFAHEFGHFCCDYASFGSAASVDVAEVFSQGMEYLSLSYVKDAGDLEVVKMVDSLCIFVEQSAFASFEQQVYSLEGDDLTAENVLALYAQVGTAYGFDSWNFDPRDFVTVTHFFTSPMYVISYVVSNDLAMQMYEMEQAEKGSGLACLEQNLTTTQTGIIAFAEEAGLGSPFAQGRISRLKETFQKVLN